MRQNGAKPLAIDLYCGLGGWAEGFLAEGYAVIGFDIEKHDYGTGSYPGQLVLQDVTTLHGSQFKDADVIVASPPCTEYSYMAMPWSRAKQIAKALRRTFDTYTCNRARDRLARGMAEERNETCLGAMVEADHSSEQDAIGFPEGHTGSRTIEELNRLFMACFRIQREACEAAGRYIPLVVENVRGAQPWVSQANANFGSYYMWGDVGMVGKRVVAGMPRFGVSVQPMGKAQKVPAAQRYREATKEGGDWFDKEARANGAMSRFGSKSDSRKAASAMIAKIPFPLARYIAQVFKP